MKKIRIKLEMMNGIFMLLPTVVLTDESSISLAWLHLVLTIRRVDA